MDGLKSFAKRLVNNYAPGPSAARFSVVSFQSVATTRVGWSTNQVDIDAAIDQMEADGATSISAGFQAAGQLFIASRPGATKIVLLFSDGEQSDDFGGPNRAIASADIVKESGVTVFAWGFGKDVRLGTLQQIATDRSKAYTAAEIGELSGYLAELEAAVCNVSPSPPPMPPSPSVFFTVVGPCTVDGPCARSPNYPSNYGINQDCTITPTSLAVNLRLSATAFNTEYGYDKLIVNDVTYSGVTSSGTTTGPSDV